MYNDRFNSIRLSVRESLKDNYGMMLCGCCLPNRKKITKLTINLLEIVYPGFYSDCGKNDINESIESNFKNTFDSLLSQIKLAIKSTELTKEEIDNKAEELTFSFFEQLPKVIEYSHSDVDEAFNGDPAATDKNIIMATYPGVFATTIQRLAHELYLLKIPYIPRIMTEYAHQKTGIDIHPGAKIGKYFFIDHGTGVVIGETTEIGEHVKIYQGVTLGALSTKDGQGLKGTKRHPTIKNHVTIYSDASVLGGDTIIEDYVTIGGNSFITKSVSKKSNKDYVFDYII